MSLRERLIALVDEVIREYAHTSMTGRESVEKIALAAARMALEEALQECRPPNAWDQEDCATELRALRDRLE